ncbi:unnamed protein product [Lactuca saligna]|uniref:Poly(A) RNA polymerase mitochondrial-like central palm domain-containing protein n=1 Tax=Lactuca saligna TaxID=75948 RepID=A0AA35ZAS9_LACSI|nr:unnamed protein product [Lactuca saligna]
MTLKKCHIFKKFKDRGHALLRALKLVSHVKKIKNTEGTCVSSVNVILYVKKRAPERENEIPKNFQPLLLPCLHASVNVDCSADRQLRLINRQSKLPVKQPLIDTSTFLSLLLHQGFFFIKSHSTSPLHNRPSPPFLPSTAVVPSLPSPPLSYGKTFKKPRRPYEKERLDAEMKLVVEYCHVRGVQSVLSAKLPILKVIDVGSGVECDLSVENRDGISKSAIIRLITSIDDIFQKLSFLSLVDKRVPLLAFATPDKSPLHPTSKNSPSPTFNYYSIHFNGALPTPPVGVRLTKKTNNRRVFFLFDLRRMVVLGAGCVSLGW